MKQAIEMLKHNTVRSHKTPFPSQQRPFLNDSGIILIQEYTRKQTRVQGNNANHGNVIFVLEI